MRRREMMIAAGAAMFGLGRFPLGYAAPADGRKRRLLFLTKSSGFEHLVVKRKEGKLAWAERILTDLGKANNFDVTCTKNGSDIGAANLGKYDAFFFYTTGNLTQPSRDGGDAITPDGKLALLGAIASGKGFVGSHCASDTFHTTADRDARRKNQKNPDPYIRMIGGEFISHGRQQSTRMTVIDSAFPGMKKAGSSFEMHEEWYALKNFAPDLHVILRGETKGMEGRDYQRPPFPATWARKHGRGRVFYTSMGHREDVWTHPIFQSILLGGISWAFRNVNADVRPNLKTVTPDAYVLER